MHRHAALLALPLALCLPLVSACSSTEDEKKTEVPLAKPSTVLDRTSQLTKAAGTTQVSSIVTAPTATTARLVKDGKVTGWSIKDGEKPTQFKITGYVPVATLPLDKIGIESNQAQSAKACNGAARVTTAVVATGKAVTAIQCGEEKKAKAVLVDGKELPAVGDRYSAEGITKALQIASAVAPKDGVLGLNLGQASSVSMILAPIKAGDQNCQYPTISVPVKGQEVARLAPSVCTTKKDAAVDKYYKGRVPVDLASLDADKTSRAFTKAATSVKAELEKCSTAQVRSVKKGEAQAVLACEVDGKKVSATQTIA